MSALEYVSWLSCFGQLVLVALSLTTRTRTERTLGRLLGLLSASLLAWNFAALAYDRTHVASWHLLDVTLSPTTPPLALHLVLALVGRARQARRALVVAYTAFGLLSLATLTSVITGPLWPALYLALSTPLTLMIVAALIRYRAESLHREERVRARLIIAAFALGGALLSTELVNDFIPWLPGLGSLGALVFTSLLSLVVTRFGLLGEEPRRAGLRYAIPLAGMGLALFALVERSLPTYQGLPVVSGLLLALLLLVLMSAMREFASELAKRRERAQRLLFLGRLSAQLAHDLKNPLAALKGALDYVQDGVDDAERDRFYALMKGQISQMRAVLEGYGRIGRLEVEAQLIGVNSLLARTVESQALANPHVRLEFEPAADLPQCVADPTLLSMAVENLVRNAAQACEAGGKVTVRTVCQPSSVLLIQVEDNGEGIAAQDKERVFDEFFTTRELGSGLGLQFVRRVAEAHGGDVALESRLGVGTIVSFCLPLGDSQAGQGT